MEPDVGVDHNDVSRVKDGADNSPTGPPTLWRRPEVPGLTARYLSLPGGHVHVINVEVSSGSRGSDEDPRLLRWGGVRVEEVRTTVEMMELRDFVDVYKLCAVCRVTSFAVPPRYNKRCCYK